MFVLVVVSLAKENLVVVVVIYCSLRRQLVENIPFIPLSKLSLESSPNDSHVQPQKIRATIAINEPQPTFLHLHNELYLFWLEN